MDLEKNLMPVPSLSVHPANASAKLARVLLECQPDYDPT